MDFWPQTTSQVDAITPSTVLTPQNVKLFGDTPVLVGCAGIDTVVENELGTTHLKPTVGPIPLFESPNLHRHIALVLNEIEGQSHSCSI